MCVALYLRPQTPTTSPRGRPPTEQRPTTSFYSRGFRRCPWDQHCEKRKQMWRVCFFCSFSPPRLLFAASSPIWPPWDGTRCRAKRCPAGRVHDRRHRRHRQHRPQRPDRLVLRLHRGLQPRCRPRAGRRLLVQRPRLRPLLPLLHPANFLVKAKSKRASSRWL